MPTTKRNAPPRLDLVQERIVGCRCCPRLVRWREKVACDKVARYRDQEYWGRPVTGFGDPHARMLVVGLAPGAHGANRTGRVFTGDRSGDFLYAALHRAGLASQPTSVAAGDGLALHDAYVITAVRCAPPDNLPLPDEIARCAPFIDEEAACLPRLRVYFALGAIAWRACLEHFERTRAPGPRPRPAFQHGGVVRTAEAAILVGSYHVSQQNTQTGRLTPAMFDEVLALARGLIETAVP
jgi:uracil-DNA glycosylase family 4